MSNTAWISITCPDRVGLIASISGQIFDLGGNLGDATFAVLGAAAEFTSVTEFPNGVPLEDIETELRKLPELTDAEITVERFDLAPVHGPTGRITHRITVSGGDRPGLVARLSEVFIEYGANIVRLNSEQIPTPGGTEYVVNMAVSVPEASAKSCLATVANTAGELGLACHWKEALQ